MTDQAATDLRNLQSEALTELRQVQDEKALEHWRLKYLARKGAVPQLLRTLKDLPLDQRKGLGQQGNQLRQELEQAYSKKKLDVNSWDSERSVDNFKFPTSAKAVAGRQNSNFQLRPSGAGHLHPLTITIRRLYAILTDMGFQLAEGPLVEEARYNFDMLNIPLEHPARAETDTFYLQNGNILRTHTSPVQVRAVLENDLTPPFKIFSPGRTFRAEKTDATHESTFHQFEGLVVGDDITIAGFKGDVAEIFTRFFGQDVTVRLRTSFFPFVEPGFEVDISCVFCGAGGRLAATAKSPIAAAEGSATGDEGKGCRVCKNEGWIEVMGAGMVHPNVLRNMNIDPDKYQGYAFGGAIDRLTMLRHGINDIRLFWSGNLDFLRQFS